MAGDPMFLQALDELRALHLSKGHDYADAADPLRNYQVSADDNGVPAWRGAQIRLSEKYHRLINLTRRGPQRPKHESIDESLLDLAAIALIVRSLLQRDPVVQAIRRARPDCTSRTGCDSPTLCSAQGCRADATRITLGPRPPKGAPDPAVDAPRVWVLPVGPSCVTARPADRLHEEPGQRWQHADPGDEAGL